MPKHEIRIVCDKHLGLNDNPLLECHQYHRDWCGMCALKSGGYKIEQLFPACHIADLSRCGREIRVSLNLLSVATGRIFDLQKHAILPFLENKNKMKRK